MNSSVIAKFNADQVVKRPEIQVGDTVKLSLKIKEGNKERVQIFEGVVISLSGDGISKTVTVRKMSYGVNVEKTIPLNMPTLEKIEILKRGSTKRAKLYYMRNRIGKRAMDVSNSENVYITNEEEVQEIEDLPVAENSEEKPVVETEEKKENVNETPEKAENETANEVESNVTEENKAE